MNESSSDEQSDSFSEESTFCLASKWENIELELNVKKEHGESERHPSLNIDSPSTKPINNKSDEKHLRRKIVYNEFSRILLLVILILIDS